MPEPGTAADTHASSSSSCSWARPCISQYVDAADPTGLHKLWWLSLSPNRTLTTIPAVQGLAQLRTHMFQQIPCRAGAAADTGQQDQDPNRCAAWGSGPEVEPLQLEQRLRYLGNAPCATVVEGGAAFLQTRSRNERVGNKKEAELSICRLFGYTVYSHRLYIRSISFNAVSMSNADYKCFMRELHTLSNKISGLSWLFRCMASTLNLKSIWSSSTNQSNGSIVIGNSEQ